MPYRREYWSDVNVSNRLQNELVSIMNHSKV